MGLIGLLMFEDAERQLHQFAHGGAQGRPSWLCRGPADAGTRPGCAGYGGWPRRRHVQRRPNPGCPDFGESGMAMETTARLTFDGNQAEKRGDLIGGGNVAAVQDGQQALGGFLADGGNRLEQVAVLAQSGIAVDVIVDRSLQGGWLLLQKGGVPLERVQEGGRYGGSPALCSDVRRLCFPSG
jgi:hypothetical protein